MKTEYQEYFKYLEGLKDKQEIVNYRNVNQYLELYSFSSNLIDIMPCALYITDYVEQKYLFMSKYCENIVGYSQEEFMSMGLKWIFSSMHPEDKQTFSSKTFSAFLNYCKTIEDKDLSKYRFSVNYRVKRRDGNYVHILQQYIILERDSERNPLLNLGVCTDITHHKRDNLIVFTVSKFDDKGHEVTVFSQIDTTKNYNISKREIEILIYIVQGYSSCEIADKLSLSPYTVRAHRRNILNKVECTNTAELSRFAITNGLI